jgi:hypothetical protein
MTFLKDLLIKKMEEWEIEHNQDYYELPLKKRLELYQSWISEISDIFKEPCELLRDVETMLLFIERGKK